MPNPIQNPRWIRDLRETCNLVGYPSLSLDETVTPVVVLPMATPTQVRTSCWGTANNTPGGANVPDMRVLNPTGSGVICSVTSFLVHPGNSNASYIIDVLEDPSAGVGYSAANVNAGILDGRYDTPTSAPAGVGGQVCVTGGFASVGFAITGRWHIYVPNDARAVATLPIPVGVVLPEGFVFRVRGDTTQVSSCSFFWEEMPNTSVVR